MKDFGSIGWADLFKGLGIAVGGTFLAGLLVFLQATPPTFPTGHDLNLLLYASGSVGVIYLIKNYFSNSLGQFMRKEPETKE